MSDLTERMEDIANHVDTDSPVRAVLNQAAARIAALERANTQLIARLKEIEGACRRSIDRHEEAERSFWEGGRTP